MVSHALKIFIMVHKFFWKFFLGRVETLTIKNLKYFFGPNDNKILIFFGRVETLVKEPDNLHRFRPVQKP